MIGAQVSFSKIYFLGHLLNSALDHFAGTSKVHYISGSLLLLRVESRDFSQAEEERTACKAEQGCLFE